MESRGSEQDSTFYMESMGVLYNVWSQGVQSKTVHFIWSPWEYCIMYGVKGFRARYILSMGMLCNVWSRGCMHAEEVNTVKPLTKDTPKRGHLE